MIEHEPPMDQNLGPEQGGQAPPPPPEDAAAALEHGRGNQGRQQQQPELPPVIRENPELYNLYAMAHDPRMGPSQMAEDALEVLTNEEFLQQCLKKDPNLNGPEMRRAKVFLEEKLKTTKRDAPEVAEEMFSALKGMLDRRAEAIQDPQQQREAKANALQTERALLEYAVELMINVADDKPDLSYHKVFTPTFEQQLYIARLKEIATMFNNGNGGEHRTEGFSDTITAHEQKFSDYINELILVRSEAHELRLSIKYGKQFQEEILKFDTHAFQFLQDEIVGLPEVVRLFERSAAAQVAQSRTWFTAENESAVQQEVRDAFFKLAGVKILPNGKSEVIRDRNGQPVRPMITKDGRQLADWEVRRALRMGENMFYSTQRMAVYSGIGNLPSIADITSRIGSLPGGEYQVRNLYAAKIAARFAAGDDTAEHFWDRIYKELVAGNYVPKRDLHGLITGEVHDAPHVNPKERTIFGLEKRTMFVNSLGAVDIESQSWRAAMMYLGSIRMRDNTTLLDLFRRNAEDIMNNPKFGFKSAAEKNLDEIRDPILGGGELTGAGKDELARRLSEQILGQRLYLSILGKYGNLSDGMKQQVWEKIAILNPSTIAAMWPDAIKGNTAWESLKEKLWIAEERRVQADAKMYKAGLTQEQLHAEAQNFAAIKAIAAKTNWTAGEFNQILAYMGMTDVLGDQSVNSLTAEERALLQKIVSTGIAQAKTIAGAKMPHTYCITDTPMISWAKTKDGKAGVATEDFIRLYTGDQVNFAEGWGAVGGFVGDPVKGDFVKGMQTGVQKIGAVIGTGGAQGLVEPFVTAWLKYASDRHPFTSTSRKWFRAPNSEFAQYNKGTFYSMNERERHITIDSLVQAGVLSDNQQAARIAGELTMADRVRKRVAADLYARLLELARVLAVMIGEEFAISFLKVALPEEAAKALPFK